MRKTYECLDEQTDSRKEEDGQTDMMTFAFADNNDSPNICRIFFCPNI
jgi:hypothetical protein